MYVAELVEERLVQPERVADPATASGGGARGPAITRAGSAGRT